MLPSWLARRTRTSGIAATLALSVLILSSISLVCSRASKPNQASYSNSGAPASSNIGTFGKLGTRVRPVTAEPLTFPVLMRESLTAERKKEIDIPAHYACLRLWRTLVGEVEDLETFGLFKYSPAM
jgi:hypothetical protein